MIVNSRTSPNYAKTATIIPSNLQKLQYRAKTMRIAFVGGAMFDLERLPAISTTGSLEAIAIAALNGRKICGSAAVARIFSLHSVWSSAA